MKIHGFRLIFQIYVCMFTTRENDSSPAHWGETYSRRKPCAFGCASLGIMSPLLLAEILVAFATYRIETWFTWFIIDEPQIVTSYHLYFLVKSLYPSVNAVVRRFKHQTTSWIVHREVCCLGMPWENRGLNGILIGQLSRDSGESVVLSECQVRLPWSQDPLDQEAAKEKY